MGTCIRKDSLPDIESLQRAICQTHKLVGIWAERWNMSKNDFDFKMYMNAEAIGNYLQEHCGHIGLDYESHLGKPPSIAGEEYLDKIWDCKISHWRKGEQNEG